MLTWHFYLPRCYLQSRSRVGSMASDVTVRTRTTSETTDDHLKIMHKMATVQHPIFDCMAANTRKPGTGVRVRPVAAGVR